MASAMYSKEVIWQKPFFLPTILNLPHPMGSKFLDFFFLESHSVIPIYKTKMIQFHILPYLL